MEVITHQHGIQGTLWEGAQLSLVGVRVLVCVFVCKQRGISSSPLDLTRFSDRDASWHEFLRQEEPPDYEEQLSFGLP